MAHNSTINAHSRAPTWSHSHTRPRSVRCSTSMSAKARTVSSSRVTTEPSRSWSLMREEWAARVSCIVAFGRRGMPCTRASPSSMSYTASREAKLVPRSLRDLAAWSGVAASSPRLTKARGVRGVHTSGEACGEEGPSDIRGEAAAGAACWARSRKFAQVGIPQTFSFRRGRYVVPFGLFVHLSVACRSASHTGLPHYSHHAPCIPTTRTYANTPPPPHACLSCLSSVCLHCRRLQGVGLRTQARPAPRIWQRPRSSPLPPRHAVRLLAPSVLGHTVYRLRLRPKPVSCGPE